MMQSALYYSGLMDHVQPCPILVPLRLTVLVPTCGDMVCDDKLVDLTSGRMVHHKRWHRSLLYDTPTLFCRVAAAGVTDCD